MGKEVNVERSGVDLILNIVEGELDRDPTLLDRAADLALEISTVFSLRVVLSPKEFALHRQLFGTRFSKAPGKNWNLTIRRDIPTPQPPRRRPARAARPRPRRIAARVPRRRKVEA